ncbi:Purine catabolism regulatory protein [Actinomadura rubteroloni]|uniref:Purine catabolism regulatory protein n=1 Tax=Actinomadura rubteroloni TaxID=1926885 RepID=A0A2P4UG88_9ACTN|nr:PucR family transcriptional regulator [Actinomadura rubteroloni]POM24036.1 Purine catabolism regulatory protein [Actinomadura rubteroloni]
MSHSPVEPGPPVLRLASTGTLTPGLSVAEVLGMPGLAGARLAAGRAGLGRVVRRLNVLDGPDVRVKPDELLLASGRVLRGARLADLAARGPAALAVRPGRPGDAMPGRLVAEADRLGLPLIVLPAGTGFDEVLNQVLTGILNRQAAVLARTEEVHRALVQIVLCGGGVQEVVDEVAAVLGVAVALLDGDGRVLVRAGRPVAAPAGSLAVPVVAGGFDHGRIVAHGALGDTELGILERAATVAALVVTKQQAVAAVESKYRADFLRDVLAGRAGDDDRITAHCAGFGWDLDRPLAVVVAELDGAQPRGDERAAQDRLTAAWTAAARRRDPGAAVASFAHEVVALVGAEEDATALAAEAAAQFAEQGITFSTGVSRTVAGPAALPEAYEQAGKAVRVGRRLHGPGARAHFDGLGVYRLLSLVPDPAELHAFVRETLGDLAAGDDPEMEDLRRTLQELLDTNLNVAETARRLHFHYNTLRYRIGKLERMLGPFTRDAHLRLNLTLALHVLRMRGI